jgi:hypothetical protein
VWCLVIFCISNQDQLFLSISFQQPTQPLPSICLSVFVHVVECPFSENSKILPFTKKLCVCVCVYPSKTVTVHIIAKVCKPYHFYTLLILPPDREVLENIWCVLNIQNLKKSVAPATDNIIYSEFFSLIYTGNVNSLLLSQLHVYISNDKCVIWGFGTRLHDVLLLMEEISPFLRFVTKCFTLECLTMFLIWYRK